MFLFSRIFLFLQPIKLEYKNQQMNIHSFKPKWPKIKIKKLPTPNT